MFQEKIGYTGKLKNESILSKTLKFFIQFFFSKKSNEIQNFQNVTIQM
jgi:hypothetical protein